MVPEQQIAPNLASRVGQMPPEIIKMRGRTSPRRMPSTRQPRRQQFEPASKSKEVQNDKRTKTTQDDCNLDAQVSGGQDQRQLSNSKRRRTTPFPNKLWRMIEDAKAKGLEHVIHFANDGTAVQFSTPRDLEEHLLSKYFVSDARNDIARVCWDSGLVLMYPLFSRRRKTSHLSGSNCISMVLQGS